MSRSPEIRRSAAIMVMQALKKYGWAFIGLIVMLVSIYLLYNELQNMPLSDVITRIKALNLHHWVLAVFFTLIAYAALAGYDRIALRHLGKHISWLFITLCSFATYALSHFIGASVFSGALVRYRAYSSKGLSGPEIAVLVAFCSFTFMLGTALLAGLALMLRPDLVSSVYSGFSPRFGFALGCGCLALVGLYVLGSLLRLKPLKIGAKFQLTYPRPKIVMQQLIIGPLELIGAAGIIYAVLPDNGNLSFIVVLGVFIASFSFVLLSNAPAGGLGVLELVFYNLIPGMNKVDVVAALAVFRLLYTVIPLLISICIVIVFESHQFFWRRRVRAYRRRMEAERKERRKPAGTKNKNTEETKTAAAPAAGEKAAPAKEEPAAPATAAKPERQPKDK